jgi:hypothetical protein
MSQKPSGQIAKSLKAEKVEKPKKIKVVRDSFTIPKPEFEQIDALKKRSLSMGISVKKSELLRAGLLVLRAMSDAAFKSAVATVPVLKTGRPEAVQAKAVVTKPVAKKPITKKAPEKAPAKAPTKQAVASKRIASKPSSKVVAKAPLKRAVVKKVASVKRVTGQATPAKTVRSTPAPAKTAQ